jgi:hypothetical protein
MNAAQSDTPAEGLDLPNYYVFLVRDGADEISGQRLTAREILESRAGAGTWPLGARTPHQRHLAEGDKIAFYATGMPNKHNPYAQSVLAIGVVAGVKAERRRFTEIPANWLGGIAPTTAFVPVRDVEMLAEPRPIRPYVERLSFIGLKEHWGLYMKGGIIRVTPDDYNLLTGLEAKDGSQDQASSNLAPAR